MTVAKKTKPSGRNIPEGQRHTVAVKLRLPLEGATALDAWAKRHGSTRSGAVMMLLALSSSCFCGLE